MKAVSRNHPRVVSIPSDGNLTPFLPRTLRRIAVPDSQSRGAVRQLRAAAVHEDCLAGQVARLFGCQEDGHCTDLDRCSQPAHGDGFGDPLDTLYSFATGSIAPRHYNTRIPGPSWQEAEERPVEESGGQDQEEGHEREEEHGLDHLSVVEGLEPGSRPRSREVDRLETDACGDDRKGNGPRP